jgi:chloramphenicol-sensitive protein RarD
MNRSGTSGVFIAASAFLIWGMFPLFWSLFPEVPSLQLLAHRVVWCAVAVWLWLLLRGDLSWILQLDARKSGKLALGGLLISLNWAVYVYAVTTGRVIDTSLGYFITPLINVALAVVVLHERLNPAQTLAIACAAAGVAWLAIRLGTLPWVALALAFSFGAYGLLRKLAPFDSVHGLAIESTVMLLPSVIYLIWCETRGQGAFLHGQWGNDLLLVAGGAVTAIPLVLFAIGAQRVSMTVLGVLQYIAPTVALSLGIVVFHEPFGGVRQIAFLCIWVGLVVFSADALWRYWARRSTTAR